MNEIARPASVCSNRKKRGLITSFLVLKQNKYISNLQVSKTFHISDSAIASPPFNQQPNERYIRKHL